MIRKRLTEFRVGVFVTAGLILAMLIIFMLGGEHRLLERHYTLYANFDSIAGLRIGAPVQVAGLKVGFVDKTVVPRTLEQRQLSVVLRVQKRYEELIRSDSEATVETQGLLGDKYIHISMGSEVQSRIPDNGIVPSKETTSIFALADKAGSILDDVGKASETIKDLLGTMHGTKGEGDLKASIASIRNTLGQIEKGNGLAHALIYDPSGGRAITDLSEGIKSIKTASVDLRTILGAMRRSEGTLGRLINDPALYDDLRALVGRANRNRLLRAVIRSTISENDRQVTK
ncbi:MAG: MlaD family protein [Pseudomonadota bacterium]